MKKRILFAIRSKLGDSLVCYASVRQYIDTHPTDDVTLLIRKDYAKLLRDEPYLKLIAFNSRIEMILKLLWLRLTKPPFDVFAVLWGFGKPIVWMARLVKAKSKIYIDGRHKNYLPDYPVQTNYEHLIEPSWLVIRMFEPHFPKPSKLYFPSLGQRYLINHHYAIGITPLADEPRRNMDQDTLSALLHYLSRKYPNAPLWIFVNPSNQGADKLIPEKFRGLAMIKPFEKLTDLLQHYYSLRAWYGTDTGLYHLATAMGIPSTVFFGPTQPLKIVMPAQPHTTWVRLKALNNDHCEEKSCERPLCLYQTVAKFCSTITSTQLEETPSTCPLRLFEPSKLLLLNQHNANRPHENPDH